jgi:hypothetical protein
VHTFDRKRIYKLNRIISLGCNLPIGRRKGEFTDTIVLLLSSWLKSMNRGHKEKCEKKCHFSSKKMTRFLSKNEHHFFVQKLTKLLEVELT